MRHLRTSTQVNYGNSGAIQPDARCGQCDRKFRQADSVLTIFIEQLSEQVNYHKRCMELILAGSFDDAHAEDRKFERRRQEIAAKKGLSPIG